MKYFRFFIVYVLAQTLLINSANAANVGGWNLSNAVAHGASTIYDASKNVVINGKDFIKDSWVKITPNTSQVVKVLARGGAGYALSIAVEQLLGSVDWVLDPANNRIVYTETATREVLNRVSCEYKAKQQKKTGTITSKTKVISGVTYVECYNNGVYWDAFVQGAYDNVIEVETEEKYLPLPVVAEKVISNAEGGDTNAQVATTAAAADIVAEAETDNTKARPIANQAEANAETKPADPDAAASANSGAATATQQADPVTGEQAPPTDISLEFPIFCNWAPTVCQAAQVVISFPQTLTGWWESANQKADQWAASIAESWSAVKDWATQQEPEENTELEIPDEPQEQIDTDIAFSGQCPPDRSVPVNLGISTLDFTFSYQLTCQALDSAKPILLLVGAFLSALIIGGIKQ